MPALKDVSSYDWKVLVEHAELNTLTVPELDKYMEHYKLSKIDKIRGITVHVYNL